MITRGEKGNNFDSRLEHDAFLRYFEVIAPNTPIERFAAMNSPYSLIEFKAGVAAMIETMEYELVVFQSELVAADLAIGQTDL